MSNLFPLEHRTDDEIQPMLCVYVYMLLVSMTLMIMKTQNQKKKSFFTQTTKMKT